MSNITQVVNTDKNLTTLKKGIAATGLKNVWSGTGPFTVFAPNDLAFAKLEAGVMEELLKPENKAKLLDLLNGHAVSGKLNVKDLKDGDKLTAQNGKELLVQVTDGNVSVSGSLIQNRDLTSSNGVVHSLETVLQN